ncbi:hypothetical protein DSECCO2_550830 [anaerobic digester metagenome]
MIVRISGKCLEIPESEIGIQDVRIVTPNYEIPITVTIEIADTKLVCITHRHAMVPDEGIYGGTHHLKYHHIAIGIRGENIIVVIKIKTIHDHCWHEIVPQVGGRSIVQGVSHCHQTG